MVKLTAKHRYLFAFALEIVYEQLLTGLWSESEKDLMKKIGQDLDYESQFVHSSYRYIKRKPFNIVVKEEHQDIIKKALDRELNELVEKDLAGFYKGGKLTMFEYLKIERLRHCRLALKMLEVK